MDEKYETYCKSHVHEDMFDDRKNIKHKIDIYEDVENKWSCHRHKFFYQKSNGYSKRTFTTSERQGETFEKI